MANKYVMTISRLTVDKLGVKLYDKVSAVIAELVSNSYDADATEVKIYAPMGEYLASKAGKKITDKKLEVKVVDNGNGMTPEEINDFFLKVGAERRKDKKRGDTSPKFRRKVMGCKGVGKLAPFGICGIIEIISAGGKKITRSVGKKGKETGYRTAHLILDRSAILKDTDFNYEPTNGQLDETLSKKTGTTIILKNFVYRRVPDIEEFARQLSQRFGITSEDWKVKLYDTTKVKGSSKFSQSIDRFEVETMANTKINFIGPPGPWLSTKDARPYRVIGPSDEDMPTMSAGFYHGTRDYFPIVGWVAYSKVPYKDELMAGVRIYCRGKIAAQTSLFNRRAGFTGEHNIRSYLVGELHADWLDEIEDLIQTDRRDILWSHELGLALQEWGQKVVLKIGTLARDPLRKKTWERFLEVGKVKDKILQAFPSDEEAEIRERAEQVAKLLGQTIRSDEVEEKDVVDSMVQLSLTLAPHVTLDAKLREAADVENTPIAVLGSILKTARIAELSSFGRIAVDRLKIIERVKTLKNNPTTAEEQLQALIENAPWLINPEWAPVTANQSFKTLKREFATYYEMKTGIKINLDDFSDPSKRPDFVLTNLEEGIEIVEIKKPHHKLTNDEMDRLITYHNQMKNFLNEPGNDKFKQMFPRYHITLVCDGLNLEGAQKVALESYKVEKMMNHINWKTFLLRTEQVHKDFIAEAEKQKRNVTKSKKQ